MGDGASSDPRSGFSRFIARLEENAIALILALMTGLTFANVVLRYVFNSAIIWSQEVTLVLFAWLVLFGVSYGFKVTAHLGVDALTQALPARGQRIMALIAGCFVVFYAVLLLKGAWDYWAPFAELPPTTGRWLPTGLDWNARGTSYFETDQIPMLSWLRWLEDAINYGDAYAKMPRMIPYTILPVASALILFRVMQVFTRIIRGKQTAWIVSHELQETPQASAQIDEAR
jgi:C4-dicarboxylate transporter DctQ subunit